MNRGSWLLAMGMASAVAAAAAPGCSSSSSGGATPSDGGAKDGTGSSSGGSSGSGGGSSSGSSSGGSSGSSSGSGDSGSDAASCPAAGGIKSPACRALASQDCCTQLTTCAMDTACAAIAVCFYANCQSGDGGNGGAQQCIGQCEADASTSAANTFDLAFVCVRDLCGGGGDGGGG